MRYSILNCILFFSIILFTQLSVIGQHNTNLPEDFPEIEVNIYDEPEPGYIFITPSGLWGYFLDATPYLAIVDNYGTPVYFQELTTPAFDFKLQPNGMLSFHGGGYGNVNHVVDSAYNIVGSRAISGYSGTDFHEFRIKENGSVLLLGWEDSLVDMSAIVPGGQQAATVRGTLIQEKDANGSITWQWSSWGHFEILETDTAHVDLTGMFIDYIHTNAVEEDDDGNILISSRNLHEITKISKANGEIMWRMGGSQNEFSFIGTDTLGFSGQHHIRKLDNGNYLLFDNGWFHPEEVSSALELDLDETNKTAEVVNRFRSQPDDIMGYIMGSSQRLPGGHTLVGWGSGVPNVTEFKPDGSKALELEFESVSYRAFKFPWRTNIFSAASEVIDFGEIYYESDLTRTVAVSNHKNQNIIITGIYNHTGKYYCLNEMPLLIPAGSSVDLELQFMPEQEGEYDDIITVYAEWESQTTISGFALQITALGSASQEASLADISIDEVEVYPNPTQGLIKVDKGSHTGELAYTLSNTDGQMIQTGFIPANVRDFIIQMDHLVPGIYFITLSNPETRNSTHRKIIKQ